jgi:hypothetical protein
VKIGNALAFAENSNHSPDWLLGSRIVVENESTIARFGVISKTARSHIIMAVYSDSDRPDVLLSQTTPTALTGSDQQIFPTVSATLSPGTYWLMAVVRERASIGYDRTDKEALVMYASHRFSMPLPERFPKPTSYSGQRFNYYLQME